VTNDGPFGTYFTVPVINQPQVAILATDGIKRRPVVVSLPDGSEAIAIHSVGILGHVPGTTGRSMAPTSRLPGSPGRAPRAAGLGSGALSATDALRIRRLGRVPYEEAATLQRALAEHSPHDYLLALEHPTSTRWACG